MVVSDRAKIMLSELSALRAAQRSDPPSLKSGDGGGTSGGVSDDWKESVNTQLKQLHDDVRRLTGYIIAGTAVPLLAIFGLYMFVAQRVDTIGNRITGVESRMTTIQVEQAEIKGKIELLVERTAPKPAK